MPVLLSYAFRPMFTLMVIYALAAVAYWGLAYTGHLPLPAAGLNPIYWHGHEMLFGLVGAAIGGFALTAVATWTRRQPVSGWPLALLAACWIVARVATLLSSPMAVTIGAVADIAYLGLLTGLMAREVFAARSTRNYKIIALLSLFLAVDLWFWVGVWRQSASVPVALWTAMWLILFLINVIGGRIVPAFTGNWLVMNARRLGRDDPARPPAFNRVDAVATVTTALFAIAFLVDYNARAAGLLGLLAAFAQLVRLLRWRGWRAACDPLVWVLHLGFAWQPVGFALLGLAAFGLVPLSAGVHALTIGAMTTMILAVASRTALGHTNRPLASHPLVTASYVLITVAAVCRITATMPQASTEWLYAAVIAWTLAFVCFAGRYLPVLTLPPLRDPNDLLARR